MPRENSFSDSDGRSLTPDLEDEVPSPSSPRPIDGLPVQSNRNPVLQPLNGNYTDAPIVASLVSLTAPKSPTGRSARRPTLASVKSRAAPPPFSTPLASLPPADRFRATVRKVMAMHRTSHIISRGGLAIGAEPGIDPRRASADIAYGYLRQQCLIEVADYSSVRSSFGRMSNREFVNLISDDKAWNRESWVKVRWINIGGISWDVIRALALRYDLHPLALEDLLHDRGHARSKADYYPKHLFLRLLCHTLAESASSNSSDGSMTDAPRSESPLPLYPEDDSDEDEDGDTEEKDKDNGVRVDDDEKTAYGSASASRFSTTRVKDTLKRRFTGDSNAGSGMGRGYGERQDLENVPGTGTAMRFQNLKNLETKKHMNSKLLRELKKGDRVNVSVKPMCIFLFRDGTVISVHQDAQLGLTAPIKQRLLQRHTGLRMTADPSLLVQSLIDLVVDQALVVTEEYSNRILKIEQQVLLKPSVQTVRRLHIIQGDLILHKRTLEPIKTVIYGLRRYDVDRVAALSEHLDLAVKPEGFMSHKSKIYLADVHDHMEYILTSMDMFAGISENLINYTFNMASYEMNEVMRRLTLATIIFLPLTLLTGYFGMNFQNMWTVNHNHSDIIFWIIALPVMAIVIPIFTLPDLKKIYHYVQKRVQRRKVKKTFKRA